MNPAPTFDRAYLVIKRRVLAGDWRPRDHIDVGVLARDVGVSTIPVREALQRLTGEHLVELEPSGGFAMPPIREAGLRALYEWHGQVLRTALRQSGVISVPTLESMSAQDDPEAFGMATEALFAAIADASSNAEHGSALRALGERLRRIRILETRLIKNLEDELETVRSMTVHGAGAALFDAITAYHRRRLRRARALASIAGSAD